MAPTKKTDNSFLVDKIVLRANHLPEGDVRLLDAYAGTGKIWRGVANVTGRTIRRLPIDKRDGFGFHLPGDNMSFIAALDLSQFNAIDLDAYGVPFEQLEAFFSSSFKGWVYVTFIQSVMGAVPFRMLEACGFSVSMIQQCPTLFYRSAWSYFTNWLARNGVSRIHHRHHERKHYIAFLVN